VHHPEVRCVALRTVAPLEELVHLRMSAGFAGLVDDQVLFRHVGEISGVIVLGEQVVIGLILARALGLGDGLPPFLGVGKHRVDVDDDSAEGVEAVTHHIADLKSRTVLVLHRLPLSKALALVTGRIAERLPTCA
jgi:hypothetical protein